jgi:hypothetical protein
MQDDWLTRYLKHQDDSESEEMLYRREARLLSLELVGCWRADRSSKVDRVVAEDFFQSKPKSLYFQSLVSCQAD